MKCEHNSFIPATDGTERCTECNATYKEAFKAMYYERHELEHGIRKIRSITQYLIKELRLKGDKE